MLPPSRALAFALLLALALPGAVAQDPFQQQDPTQELQDDPPEAPRELQCQTPVDACLPDLIPTNPRVEVQDERSPATFCTDFVNVGEGPTAAPFRILLTIDQIGIAEEQVTGAYQTGEGGANICWDSVSLVAGRHSFSVLVDAEGEIVEKNETNNQRGSNFNVLRAPKVDLRLTSLQVTPKDGGTSANQVFIVNVTNGGNEASPAAFVTLEDDMGPMTNWTTPALKPAQSVTLVFPTRPEYRSVGTFVARAVVDPSNAISELSEGNNEALTEYTVLEHPAPDYRISKVVVAGNRTEMRGVRVDVTVENVGDRASRGATLRLVNETNKTLAQGVTTSILYPDTSSVVQFYMVLHAGNHSLRLIADPNNKVAERNEVNNEWNFTIDIAESIHILDQPNLLVERVYAMPEDPRPGESVSVGALVHNVGTNKSNATTVSFSVDGKQIATAAIPSLKPDAYYSAYVPWPGGTSGTHIIEALADPSDKISELDEGDNALDLEFLITTQKPPEEEQPPPIVTPPVLVPTPPSATPTPATPTPTPKPANDAPTASRVVLGELVVSTKPVPGGVKGVVSASLRNPLLEPLGRFTVTFKVDGETVSEKLLGGILGAATIAATTGEIELPEGKHTVSAEVHIVGSSAAPLVRSSTYEEAAGEKTGVPGVGALGLLGAAAIALILRRKRDI